MLDKLEQFDKWVISKPAQIKQPLQTNGKPASVTNSSHWTSYKRAAAAIKKGVATHVGFVFTSNDPFCVFDFDNKEGDEKIQESLKTIVDRETEHNHCCETSFSGRGYHIIIECTQLTSRRKGREGYLKS